MADDRPERMAYPFPLPADLLDDDGEEEKRGVSPFAMANHLLRNARLVILLPLLAFVLAAAYISTRDRNYVATSRFLSAKADFGAPTGGVMSQLNRLVGGATGGSDGMFYRFLVQSTAFLREAARDEYEFTRISESGEEETVRGTLAEIYGGTPATEESNVRASLGILKSLVSSNLEPGTGFVSIAVQAPWPGLAVAVNERLLELVNEFNLEQRQSQAAAEREFVEARLADAAAKREAAEDELVAFLQRNQQYDQAPRLRYEALRLESEVELKRALYSSLAQSLEQARINEVRNTPVISVVERPQETVYRPNPGSAPLRYGVMAFLIMAVLTIGFIAARGYLARQSEEHPDDFREFRRLARNSIPMPERLRGRLAARSGRDNGADPTEEPRVPAESSAGSGSSESW